MKKRTLFKGVLISITTVISLSAAVSLFVYYQLSHMENYKQKISTAVGNALNRDVSYEKGIATLTFRAGLSLQFTNVVIREKNRASELLNIGNAFFSVELIPLLANRVIFKEVILDQPRLSLYRDHEGVLNIADLMSGQMEPGMRLELKNVTIEKGIVSLMDQAVGEKGLVTSLENLYCRIDLSDSKHTSRFNITATINENKNQGELSLKGNFRSTSSEKNIWASIFDASIKITGTDIQHYWPYLAHHLPFEQLAGRLDVETTVAGTLSNFTSKGTFLIKNVLLHYPRVFRETLRPQSVHVDYVLTRDTTQLKLDITHLTVDNFNATGRFAIHEMGKEDPQIEVTADTSIFSLKEIKSYIPWGIIPQNVGRFIEDHIRWGDFRLVEGKLSGRLSQIAHIEKQENAGVLSIRAEVNKGVFVVGIETPDFQDISGILEMKNRKFSLQNMTGHFGNTPFKMEGNISDFSLPDPVVYTADITLQPVRDEVLWLLGNEKFRNLRFDGTSKLLLSGKGPATNYKISAQWDLTDAAYAYPDVMVKPRGRPNQLSAEIILNKDAFRVSAFKYKLAPLILSGAATYCFDGDKPLSLNVKSNNFDIQKAVLFLPVLRKFDPAGSCLVDISGRGDPRNSGSFQWKGSVSMTNAAFKSADVVKRVSGFTGSFVFKGERIETTWIKARIGQSDIRGKCRIDDFRKVQVICQFDAPLLHDADIGLKGPAGDLNFHDVKGQIRLGDNSLKVDRLSLRLGKSLFNLSGDVRDFSRPKIVVSLNSPYINSEDVDRLLTMRYLGRRNESSYGVELDAILQVDEGIFNGANFKKLNAGLKFSGGMVNIESLEASVMEGKLKGKGRVDIRPDGQNRYEVNFSLDRISMDKLQGLLEIGNRTITGNLSLAGDVTATGSKTDELKKTATGTFQLKFEKGVLKKFPVFSKIFSVLNVSQLLKFKLPDMAKDGMPYTKITAGLALKNGVIASEDFIIDSDAIRISAVGKVDLLKKELDTIVGVYPLQTLDRIVVKIPIAGWILTNEDGRLIIVHFKADGSWDDPKVTPIPVHSLPKGTLDIFRRLFQLPGKLVTDKGEVIPGR